MNVVPGHVALAGTAHIALGCVTNATGQTACNGTSAGLFEPAWDPRRLHTLEARMESWQRSAPQQRGTRLS